jgi:hypothetical protein
VKDLSDVPPVNLASLPLAARTPGGGVKTAVATKSPVRAVAKAKPAAKRPVTAKKSVATKKPVVVEKKKDPA